MRLFFFQRERAILRRHTASVEVLFFQGVRTLEHPGNITTAMVWYFNHRSTWAGVLLFQHSEHLIFLATRASMRVVSFMEHMSASFPSTGLTLYHDNGISSMKPSC